MPVVQFTGWLYQNGEGIPRRFFSGAIVGLFATYVLISAVPIFLGEDDRFYLPQYFIINQLDKIK